MSLRELTPLVEKTPEPGVHRRFFANTSLNFAGQAYLLLLNFVAAPYIVHHLGAELFGVLALVQTLAGFAGLLNLGMGRSVTKYVSELYWRGNSEEIRGLFQTAWATCLACGLIGFVSLIGPRKLIGNDLFRGGPATTSVTEFAIYIAAFGLFSSLLTESLAALPVAFQKFNITNGISILVGTTRNLGAVIVLALGFSIKGVLLVSLAASFVEVICYVYFSRKLIPGLSLRPRFDWAVFKHLLKFSLPILISGISAMLITRIDRVMLAYFLPIAAITFYALPYSLAERLAFSVGNVTSVVFPFASELMAQEAHDKLKELYLRATKILTLLMLPLTAILIAVPGPILRCWLGAEFAEHGATALRLLAIAIFLNAMSAVPTVIFQGIGRPWIATKFALASSVVNVVLNVLLIPRYGLNGAAAALLLQQALVVPLFVYQANRALKVSSWWLVANAYFGPLACAFVSFTLLGQLGRYMVTLPVLVLLCALSLGVYGIMALFGAINGEERAALFGEMARWRKRTTRIPPESESAVGGM